MSEPVAKLVACAIDAVMRPSTVRPLRSVVCAMGRLLGPHRARQISHPSSRAIRVMTMEASSNEVEFLAGQTIQAKQPVTYRVLARELELHVDHAKRVLFEFYKANRDKLTASFIITGTNESGILIKLSASEEDVASDSKAFTTVNTVHIYCVHLKQKVSEEEISAIELKYSVDLTKVDEFVKRGLIEGPKLTIAALAPPIRKPTQSKATPPSVKKETDKLPETKTPKSSLSSGYVSRKATVTPTSKKQGGLLSMYTSRKGEKPVYTSRKNEEKKKEPSVYQYQSRKAEKDEPKERVVISSIDDEVDEKERKAKESQMKELENLFVDDFTDDDEESVQDVLPKDAPEKKAEGTSAEEAATPITESETPIAETSAEESLAPEKVLEKAEETPVAEAEETPEEQPETKSLEQSEPTEETVIDEDGFITTYRKKPPASAPRKRSAPVSSSSAKRGRPDAKGSKKQASLMSFFQKR